MTAKPSAKFITERRTQLMQQASEAAALADAGARKKALVRNILISAAGVVVLIGVGAALAIVFKGQFHGSLDPSQAQAHAGSDLVQYASNSPDSPPPMMATGLSPSGQADQAAAETQLLRRVADDHSVEFQGVSARQAGSSFTFCGQVNLLDPSGAYSGFQRFIASPSDALLENSMTPGDFAAAWSGRCES